MTKLLEAGLSVFGDRGYHSARVDDIVRTAATSHGTFYLYFDNKEDLLRALALECAAELGELADGLGAIEPDQRGRAELARFVTGFHAVYRRFGPVIRAWMEEHVTDRTVNQIGIDTYTHIAHRLSVRMRAAVGSSDRARVSALMAMLERHAYYVRGTRSAAADRAVNAVATVMHRGFFGGAVA